MALKIGDRVRENTSSTGVGGLSLTGAPAGFQRFSAVLASGDTTYYSLEENDKFEIGIGTYGSNNLERTTILSSSNSGNKISLGGSGVVFITYPAAKAIFNSETDQLVLPVSGLLFNNGTAVKDAKLVELTDVNLSGTPVQSSVFDLNITNKSLSIGDLTGPTNSNNILIGYGAGSGITTGSDSVIIGAESSTINKTGQHNVHIGAKAGPVVSDAASSVYNSVAVGYSAGNKMRHESVAIGYEAALHAYEIGFIGIGYQVGSGIGSYATAIGYQAGRTLGEDYAVALGYQAGYNGAGEASVWIGQGAGHSSTSSTKSIGIGKNAGKSSSGTECIYLGEGAGTSNSSNNLVFIGNATPASNGTLIKGDMDAKRVAVGAADVTLDDTFFVGVNSANDEGLVVKAAASQVSNLTSWKNNSDAVLASVSKDGVVSAHEIVATGNGIQIADLVPASTTNKLYNDGGTLKFNGSAIGGGGGGDVTTAQLNYVSGIAVYSSGVVTGGTPTFGNMYVDQYIYHNGDNDTYIRLRGDQFDFVAGGRTMLTLDEAGSDIVTVNDGANDVDFQVKGDSDTNLIRTDAANDLVGIGTSSPAYKLDVFGHDAWIQSSGIHVGASGIVVGAGGDINLDQDQRIYFEADKGTWIETDAQDRLRFVVGGNQMLLLDEDDDRVNIGFGNKLGVGLGNNTSPAYDLDVQGMAQASGVIVGNSGVVLARNTPGVTTDTLYNIGGALYFNGSQLASAGASAEATYASGQAISNQSNITALNTASGIATSLLAVSGTATSLISSSGIATYASGQAIANESDIAALLTASGTATSLIASSGIATYASGQAIANESDIVAVSGIAVYSSGLAISNEAEVTYASGLAITNEGRVNYASGLAITNEGRVNYASGQAIANESDIGAVSGVAYNIFNIVSGDGSNYTFDGMGLGNASDPDIYLHKGHSYTFNKTFSGHPFRVSATEGGSVYQDADGNNIEIGSAAAEVRFEVPQNAPDKLHYYCTAHASNMKGVIYTTNNVDEIIHVSGIAAYASGQATSLNTASGVATYASGQAIANEGDLVAVSGIAAYASGVSLTVKEADNSPNVSNVRTIVVSNGTLTDNGGGQVTLTTGGGGGGGDVSTAQLNYVSGIAVYASGQSQSLNTVSGVATSLVASSGIATYASGQAIANESDIVATSGIANYASGQVVSSTNNGSGIIVDASRRINIHSGTGNFQQIDLTSNNIFTPKMVFTGSGVKDTPVTMKVLSSHGAVNTSGTALSFEGTQGQLFGITDNLSSGNIFSVADITGLPLISADASGDVKLGEYGRYVGVGTGVPLYGFDVSSSGQFQKGFVLSNYVPATTTNTLYNEGGTLKFNGAATYAPLLTASGAAVYASGQVNVSAAGTATASKALVLDSAKSFTGTKHGVFNEFDSRVTASGVTVGASGITLTGGAYVQEAVPANDTPATEDATITLDLSTGNYHNVILGNDVTKFEFLNAKRGQRFLLRITQHAASAKTIAWTNVDYTSGGAAATVRWAGGGTAPTMSTSTSHTDVYGFLCTNNAGSAFDGFVVGQDLPD